MTMIRQVGEAIVDRIGRETNGELDVISVWIKDKDMWDRLVDGLGRTAIQAMMEPTDGMLSAAYHAAHHASEWESAIIYWKAMLQAALEEKP